MKFTLSFATAVLLAISSVSAAPRVQTSNPVDRLDALRDQLERFETPIIHTYLARTLLGSIPNERSMLVHTLSNTSYPSSDAAASEWLGTRFGRFFASHKPFPPAVEYITLVTLPRDAVLDKPVVGKGIYPIGRRPQDPLNVERFLHDKFDALPKSSSDAASVVSLDTTLFHLASARMMLGYPIARAKFDWLIDTFCPILLNTTSMQEDKHAQVVKVLTDHKQEVNVLSRVQEKAKALSQVFRQDPAYPKGAEGDVLRLFQAYLIPVTTQIEAQVIIDYEGPCDTWKPPKKA